MASIQDNNNSELDTALVDRAWTQMHQQLEVAMPQRKRPGFVWWWALFALVGVSLLAFWLWPRMDNTQYEESGSEKKAVIADAPQASNDEMIQPTNDQDAKDQLVTSNLSTTSERTELSGQPTSEHRVVTSNLSTKPEPSNRPTTEPPNRQTTKPSNRQTTEPTNRPTVQPPNRQTTEPPNRPTAKPFNLIPTINHQPSLRLAFDPLTHYRTNNAPKQSPWNYYLETQAGFSLGDAVQNGLSIGGGVQRSLTNKIKLEAGLQYQWQRSSLLIGSNSDAIADTEALFDTIFPSSVSAYNLTLSSITRDLAFNKLNLYVGGHFQVKPRLSFGLGGQISYFTQAYVVVDAGELALAQGGVEDLDGNNLDLYGGDVSVYERVANTNAVEGPYVLDVRRWQLSVNTSVRYRFARHWETSLQYQAHLTSWPNQDLTFGGGSTVQLGLRYYLR